MTVINASAAVTLLEQRPEKIQALSGIRTHDLCDASAVLSQLRTFSGLCSSSVTAALALMTVRTQLLLMDKINFQLVCVRQRQSLKGGKYCRYLNTHCFLFVLSVIDQS